MTEYHKLKERFSSFFESHLRRMDEGIELKGYKYKSHYLAILKWAEKDKKPKDIKDTAREVADQVRDLE